MKITLKSTAFLFYAFALFLCSCKHWQEIKVIKVDRFNLNKVSIKEIEGELQLTINNPNSVGFSIYRSEFDISYGDVKLGKAKLHKRVHIGSHTEKAYTFKLKTNPESIELTDIIKLIGNAGSGTIQIKGDLKAGKFFIKRKYPVNYQERIQLIK